jgi:hypothetical protein
MLTVTYAEGHILAPNAECRYAECHCAECRGTILRCSIRENFRPNSQILD